MNNKDFEEKTDEELVEYLQGNFDNGSMEFRTLFKRCSKKLYMFLIKKGYSKSDSDDILQDYFGSYGEGNKYSNFENAIIRFDTSYGKKFVNYVKRILMLRLISHMHKEDKKKSVISGSTNKKIDDNDNVELGDLIGKEYFDIDDLFLEDMRVIITEHIYSIENENHKTALICRLCLPFKMSVSEIAEILEMNERTLSTCIYRGVSSLTKLIKEDRRLKNLSYEDTTKRFIDKHTLNIKREALKDAIPNDNEYEIFEKILYNKKKIEEISEDLRISIIDIKKILKKGIRKLVSNKDYLLK